MFSMKVLSHTFDPFHGPLHRSRHQPLPVIVIDSKSRSKNSDQPKEMTGVSLIIH